MKKYLTNKKARFNFEIIATYEAGLVLFGHEVKAIRAGKGSLVGSYVLIRGGEAFLVNATFGPYQIANTPKDYDPERPRKLLLSRKEISALERKIEEAGLTLVAISLYDTKSNLKLEVALARGKKKADKRETIKKRDSQRSIQRILKNQ